MKKLLLLAFLLCCTINFSFAQDFWEPYDIPNEVPISGFASDDDGYLYACNFDLFFSSDKGVTWTRRGKYDRNDELVTFRDQFVMLNDITIAEDGYMYMIMDRNRFLVSSDNGEIWENVEIHSEFTPGQTIDAIECHGNVIYIYSKFDSFKDGKSIFGVSTNHGASWNWVDIGDKRIHSINVNGDIAWAGTTKGLYMITNDQGEWTLQNDDMIDSLRIDHFVFWGMYIAASSGDQIYASTDGGKMWMPLMTAPETLTALYTDGIEVYGGTESGKLLIYDGIGSYNEILSFPGRGPINMIYANGKDLFVQSDGLYHTSDGSAWNKRNKGITNGIFRTMTFDNDNTAYLSTFTSLHIKAENEPDWRRIHRFVFSEGQVMTCTDNSNYFYMLKGDSVYISLDKGITWAAFDFDDSYIQELFSTKNGRVFVIRYDNSDGKEYLTELKKDNMEIIDVKSFSNPDLVTFNNNDIIAVLNDEETIHITDDYGANWVDHEFTKPEVNFYPESIAFLNLDIFITNGEDKIFKSTDFGTSWTEIEWTYTNNDSYYGSLELIRLDGHIYATSNAGIYAYDEISNSFKDLNLNIPHTIVAGLAQDRDGYLYLSNAAGTYKSISPVTSVNEIVEISRSGYVNPNPSTTGISRLSLSDVKPGTAYSIKIFNSLGTEVMDLGSNTAESAAFTLYINTELLGSGAFFISFSQDGISRTIPFTVVR